MLQEDKLRFIQKLQSFKIPESEYMFFGELPNHCLYIEKKEENVWEVYDSSNGEKTVKGIFFKERAAYDFLFYLIMKKHVNIKKRWW